MQKFIPIGNRVFIQPDSATNISDGGIIMAKEKTPNTGVVVCVSADTESVLVPGDRVRFIEGSGLEENGLLLIDQTNILYVYGFKETGGDLPESNS